MILADTSAWVEYLRRTGSATNLALREAVRADEVVVVDPVRTELLAGARSLNHRERLGDMLGGVESEPLVPGDDWDAAADLYLTCRASGDTVRSLIDCLIGAVGIRLGLAVLHHDRDFTCLARHSALEVAPGSFVLDD